MMVDRRLVAVFVILVLSYGVIARAEIYNVQFRPRAVSAAGEDYTARATCKGLWFITSTRTDDHCDAAGQNGEDTLTENGDPTSSSTVPTGASGNSVDFDGTGDYFTLADDTAFESNAFTVCAWIHSDNTAGGWVMEKHDGTNGWTFALADGNRKVSASVRDKTEQSDDPAFSASVYFHFCARYSHASDVLEVYVDGVEACSTPCVAAADRATSSTVALGLGADAAGGFSIDALMYEVAYFAEELAATEICEICRKGIDGTVADRPSDCNTCTLP